LEFKRNLRIKFSFLHELESLLENGLIKGGDLNNAIVYVDKEISAGTMENLKLLLEKIR
jgi:UDP-3-O-[3-hydroxymyristoyl] N-acetylglucosamine deacetylase/3-hydroxyacyl-[acyl-carrier-protein] dehydratase